MDFEVFEALEHPSIRWRSGGRKKQNEMGEKRYQFSVYDKIVYTVR